MKGFAIDGATTTHGGVIRASQQNHSGMGLPFLRAGDGHYCPQCKCWSTIQKSHNHVIFDGQPVAYENDLLSCGAKISHQQNHTVGDSQGSFTISFGDLPNESPTESNFISKQNFQQPSTAPLDFSQRLDLSNLYASHDFSNVKYHAFKENDSSYITGTLDNFGRTERFSSDEPEKYKIMIHEPDENWEVIINNPQGKDK